MGGDRSASRGRVSRERKAWRLLQALGLGFEASECRPRWELPGSQTSVSTIWTLAHGYCRRKCHGKTTAAGLRVMPPHRSSQLRSDGGASPLVRLELGETLDLGGCHSMTGDRSRLPHASAGAVSC